MNAEVPKDPSPRDSATGREKAACQISEASSSSLLLKALSHCVFIHGSVKKDQFIYNLHHYSPCTYIYFSNALQVVNPSAASPADLQLADCRRAGRWRLECEGYGLICLGSELAALVCGDECRVVARDGERGGLGINVLEIDSGATGSLQAT